MTAGPPGDRRRTAPIAFAVLLLGIAMVVLALLGLRGPVQADAGTTDLGRLLTSVIALGALLALAGGATLLRALRARRSGDDPPPRR